MRLPKDCSDFVERNCPECGKNFIVPPMNVYKEKVGNFEKPFCSWNCLSAWRKKHKERERIGGGRPVKIRKVAEDGTAIKEYPKIMSAAVDHNMKPDRIKAFLESGAYDENNECFWEYIEPENVVGKTKARERTKK